MPKVENRILNSPRSEKFGVFATKARRRLALRLSAAVVLLPLGVAAIVGWFDGLKSWQEASGFLQAQEFGLKLDQGQSGINLWWLGHGGYLLEIEGVRIAFDPNLSSHCSILPRLVPAPVKAGNLPKIDAVLISHAHYDHLDFPTLSAIPELTRLVLPAGSETFLPTALKQKIEIHQLEISQSIVIDSVKITAVLALHNGSRFHPFSSKYHAQGYVIQGQGASIYLAGDTGYGEHFSEIAKTYQPQFVVLPIGGFEPYLILKNYHLSPEDAVRAAANFPNAKIFPTHFGTFRIAGDRLDLALPRFTNGCKSLKLDCWMPRMYEN